MMRLLLTAAIAITSLTACSQSMVVATSTWTNAAATRLWSVRGQIMLDVAANDWQHGKR